MALAIGRRLGEMHVVLARPTDNPAFSPRAARPDDVAAWIAGAEEEVTGAYKALADTEAAQVERCRGGTVAAPD